MAELTSTQMVVGEIYTRDGLRELFGITDATISNGIFHPKGTRSVWLFVTEEKTPDRVQYTDHLDGDVLLMQGQTEGRTDHFLTDQAVASVSWDYPKDRMLALQKQASQAQAAAPVDAGLLLERIRFRYAISGSSPSWKPLRAFDDGEKAYIQFPASIGQGELPPLFVIGSQGDGQLVNYRFRSPYYVVDRLFGAAELRLGADKGVVRIKRTDGVTRGAGS